MGPTGAEVVADFCVPKKAARSAAADRLILREYQGMEFEMPSGSSKILGVNPGKFGIASGYCHSSDNLC